MTTPSEKHWTENFRILTPILVTIAIFELGSLLATVNKIDDKLFKHLTNDELHCPRSIMLSRQEFAIYQTMQDEQNKTIRTWMVEIRDLLNNRFSYVNE